MAELSYRYATENDVALILVFIKELAKIAVERGKNKHD